MQCPNCGAENREDRRFCAECGGSLSLACPVCGFGNEPGEKFCGGCGTALVPPSAQATKPERQPRAQGEAAPEAPEAERRQLTVMFCDLVGSTALSERLDPEDLREVIHTYQECCAGVIGRFEGYIARYMGDGLLVYFGYPQAHEDDAERAIRAGLGIVEAVGELRPREDLKLEVRVGIATGLVVAGDHIGAGASEEKAVVGETPNLAARLQGLAEPDTVVIAPSTYRLAGELFVCDDLGPQHLKGITEPVPAFLVRQAGPAPSRFDATHAAGMTPLVGREEEINLLLNRWNQAKDGDGQVILLSGAAGVGKSRIVRSFRQRLEDELRNRVLYYCSPFHQNSAFYPAINQLERGLRFVKEDGPAAKLDKLEAVLGELGLPVPEIAPLLASLLSLPVGDRYPAPPLAAEELKKKILEALIAVFEAMASLDPVLIVVEDLHWIDPSTLELLSLLIEHLGLARVVLLLTFRPEFDQPWGDHAHITGLTLNRLSRRESAAMIARVAGGKAVPEEVLGEIVAKTDGVPLFVEELTKTVLESDLLEEAEDRYVLSGPLPPLAIPASLQDSLMARLDRLAPVKEVAQLAATLGRTFSHELLAAVSSLKGENLEDALSQLLNAGLIYRHGLPPAVTYEFKHALVQDVAYQSLLKGSRLQFHERIAHALEERFPETEPELLAHHFTEAGLTEQAVGYWQRAGQRTSERSANLEAIAHLTKGLELIKGLPDTPEQSGQELGLHLALGPALMATKGWPAPEVGQAYRRAQELCRQVGKPAQVFTVTWGLWLHYQQRGQLETAQGLADEVLALAEGQADPAFRLQAHHAAWTTQYRLGEFSACGDHTERGIALYDIDKHRSHAFLYGGHDPGVCSRVHAGMSLWSLGYPDKALEAGDDAVALAKELGHPFSLTLAQFYLALIHQFRQEADLAQERAEATIALCAEQGFAQISAQGAVMRGWAVAARGHTEEGIAEMRGALMSSHPTGAGARRSYFLALLAEACGHTGQAEEGLSMLVESLDVVEKTGERTWEAEIHRVKGDLLLVQSAKNTAEAEACFNRAIDVARRQSAKSPELRAATSLARLWHQQGKTGEARDLLAPVYNWFSEGFGMTDLKEAKALLKELS
jgi:predicted ATPase/class 3 adenylate cyclase